VDLRVLGTVELRDANDETVRLNRRKERLVLAFLALSPSRVVSADQLVGLLWEHAPPATARATLHTVMSRVRSALRVAASGAAEQPTLVQYGDGYLLGVQPQAVDLHRFRRLVDAARRATDPRQRSAGLAAALQLWRGPALADAAEGIVRARLCTELEEERLAAQSDWIEAELALGRHAGLVPVLSDLVTEHPMREGLHRQLMLALYRGGRRADALQAYRRARRVLVDELGVEPGPELRQLLAEVLRDDPLPAGPVKPAPVLRGPLVEELGLEPAAQLKRSHARMLAGDPGLNRPDQLPAVAERVSARQLPAGAERFVGRHAELDRLDAVAAGNDRLALVVGAAGAGKTALALHWARRSAHRFPDGQLFVDKRGFHTGPAMPATEALPLLLVALGLKPEQIPISLDAQAGLYRSTLAGRRVLVILDNVADTDQVRPLIPGEPGCLVLVTSRDRLSGLVAVDGARRITLDVLPTADAVEVLAHVAGRHQVDADPAAAAELARLCGHLPLALRIAGARLADRPHLDVRVYAKELVARGPMTHLRVEGDDTATVRTAFDLSYQALPSGAKRVFRLLGLVPAPTGLAATATAALCGLPADQIEPLVDALARFHLVNLTADGRTVCHDLLLQYATELTRTHARPAEQDAAIDRLLHFYVHTTDRAATALIGQSRLRLPRDPMPTGISPVEFIDQTHAREWISTEWANLVAALDAAAASGRHQTVWHLANALRDFTQMQAPATQGLHITQTGLTAAQRAGDTRGEAAMRLSLGYLRWRTAEYQEVLHECQTATALARRAGWRKGESAALCNTGIALAQLGKTRPAIRRFEQSLAIDREIGDRIGEATKLINLTAAHEQVGNLSTAAEYCELALPLQRETGQHQGHAIATENLAVIRREQGRLEDALHALEQSLTISKAIGAQHEQASALITLGLINRDAGRYDRATTALTASLEITQLTCDIRLESFAHTGLAGVHIRQGHLDEAADSLGIALDIAHRTGHHRGNVETLLTLADLHTAQHDHHGAHEQASQALNLARTSGYALLVAQAHARLAIASLGVKDLTGCLNHCKRAVTIQRRAGQRLGLARTLLTMGNAHQRLGHTRPALACLRQAHTTFDDIGAPERIATAALLSRRHSATTAEGHDRGGP
jgi:DNA-binding SARP family transcriptional activator/Tfp pilus assembly protein PilF